MAKNVAGRDICVGGRQNMGEDIAAPGKWKRGLEICRESRKLFGPSDRTEYPLIRYSH